MAAERAMALRPPSAAYHALCRALITPLDSVPAAIRRKVELLTTPYWGALSDCNQSLALFTMS